MKITTHVLALLMIFSLMSLIGCNNNQQATAQSCIAQGPSCTGPIANQAVAAYMTANPAARATMLAQLGVNPALANATPTPIAGSSANNLAILAPVPATGQTQVLAQAQRVQQGLKEASANPSSSYYVDQTAPDIPTHSAISEKLAALQVTATAPNRQAAPQQESSGTGDTGTIQ